MVGLGEDVRVNIIGTDANLQGSRIQKNSFDTATATLKYFEYCGRPSDWICWAKSRDTIGDAT